MENAALQMLTDIPWGASFNQALKVCQEKEYLKIIEAKEKELIEVAGKCDNTDFHAKLIFKGFFKKLRSVSLDVILKKSNSESGDATQFLVDDFLKTYYVAVEMFGKADMEKGIPLEQLKDLDYLGGANFEKLPHFQWTRKETIIEHKFTNKQDGVAISTTLRRK